ncbi:HEAT repeat domain-containing protein [Kitasatospora sp. NPDC004615]|uniref:HEAT repeat domain-containing protein n=1 Tax=Kitasatospora sp. NPDC004615 TaxID=3364017 RepID=UPI00367C85A3
MRTPEELHLVDWPSLHHAFGEGTDVPGWIRALYDEDGVVVDEALDELFGRALHQGTVYPASVAAVPYLAHAAVHAVHRRDSMLAFLANAGRADADRWFDDGTLDGITVSGELPGLLHLLRDEDPEVRRRLVRVARWAAGDELPLALDALTACHRDDPSARVRAEALAVLGRLDPDPAGRLRAALTDSEPAVRAMAALGLLESGEVPYPAELVDVLAADGGSPVLAVPWAEFFHGVGSTDDRAAAVLDSDAEACRTVAAAWIAAGDHDGRGSRLAVRLSDTWRDREADTVALLARALPHQREWHPHMQALRDLARWVDRCPDPGPAAEAALPYVTHPDWRIATAAQLVLGRAGDTRLLTAVPEPDRDALAALAARTDDLQLRRRVLTPYLCGGCDRPHSGARELLAALTPADAGPLLPELTRLLRDCPSGQLVRVLGGTGLADPELIGLLEELAATASQDPVLHAAVAAVRLGADPAPALRLLAEDLGRHGHAMSEIALLGPLASPLLPLVEPYLTYQHEWSRARAAEALWSITGDAARAVPVLTELLQPLPVGAFAVAALRRMGAALSDEQRATVEEWARADRRVLGPFDSWEHQDDRLREEARLLLDQQP